MKGFFALLFNSGIGIDIRNDQVNIVYLKGSFKGVRIAAESHCTLDDTRSPDEKNIDIAEFINNFIADYHIQASGIFVGIAGGLSISREIEFPLAVKENLSATLLYEMEKYIPIPVEDIYFDYQIIMEDKEKEKLKLLLVVVKKKEFEPYLQIAGLLKKGISGVEIIPAAVSNYYLSHNGNPGNPEARVVLIHFQNNGFDIMLIQHQAMLYTRSIDFTGDGFEGENRVVEQLIKIKNTFLDNHTRTKLVLYGSCKTDEVISHAKAEGFDIVYADKGENNVSDERFIPAYGLALKGVGKVPVDFNIMPAHLRTKPDRTSYLIMTALVVLLFLSGLVWAGSHLATQRFMISQLDTELARLRSEAFKVEAIRADVTKLEKRIRYMEALRPTNVNIVDVVKELTEIIPETAWLKDFKLSKNKLNIYGEAESASELIPLLEASPLFEDVKFLSTIRKAKNDKEVFRIGLSIVGR